MTPFLKIVAEDIYEKFNGKLEDVAIVFPNKRAGLFFSEYLLEKNGGKPMWSPRYMTIGELFQKNSKLAICDPLLLVSKLYKEYMRPMKAGESKEEYEKSIESLDEFYYWGEVLIKDFDDIDKHLVNAKELFTNIKDLRDLGNGKGTLTEEQAKSVQRFFVNFNMDKESEIKQSFIDLWERLYSIYCSFKESLRQQNLAYEGMLYRNVIENCDNIVLEHSKYVFVGFNALNDVERALFDIVHKRGKAIFYWDYDKHYTINPRHEAGHFMRKNLERFPNELKGSMFNNLAEKKNVTVVEANNDSIETRYLSTWLDNNLTQKEIETAIVLCDETMLESVIHTLPPVANRHKLEHLNVTMGFPVSHTPIFTFIKQIVELGVRGWSEKHNRYMLSFVSEILRHPYVVRCSQNALALCNDLMKEKRFFPEYEILAKDEFLSLLFLHHSDNKEWLDNILAITRCIADSYLQKEDEELPLYDKIFVEAIYKVFTQVQRFRNLVDSGELHLKQKTLGRLLTRVLSSLTIPFHGEPVVGLQIMGLLETRNLDFKNIILLGVNEGNLPKKSNENSYVPYNLRRAFGLTLGEHRDSIYSYYFYRLLQRAENITLVYNSSTESRGECSRYIQQLLGSKMYDVKHLSLTAQQGSNSIDVAEIEKNDNIIKKLRERFDRSINSKAKPISPSAINKYIRCGMSFFYRYVLDIQRPDDINDEVQTLDFGNIFHCAADTLYKDLAKRGNGIINKELLEPFTKNEDLLLTYIDAAFSKEFFNGNNAEYNGEQYINRDVLHRFLKKLVKIDYDFAPFTYVDGEQSISMPYTINCAGYDIDAALGGKIDRVDIKDGTINIVDYKTGVYKSEEKTSLDDIFANEITSAGNRIQAFMYSVILDELMNGKEPVGGEDFKWLDTVKASAARKISPSLLYIHTPNDPQRENFIIDVSSVPVTDIRDIKEEYMIRLDAVLKEIFDNNIPFKPTCNSDTCKYCDYKEICGR